jgi:hypothetical protein
MSKAPRYFIKSRENIQAIYKNREILRKYELFDRILEIVWYDIIKPQNYKTSHTIGILTKNNKFTNCISLFHGYHVTEEFILELVEILKLEYPGCDVTYSENKENGKIVEQLITIDWS